MAGWALLNAVFKHNNTVFMDYYNTGLKNYYSVFKDYNMVIKDYHYTGVKDYNTVFKDYNYCFQGLL